MIRDLGVVHPGQTLYLPFHTFDSNDPSASVTLTGLATTDVEIYKDGSVTQRASDNGYALLDTDGIDFDSVTGIHGLSIDLADNSTAGFYAAGSQYWVVIASVTVDAATVNFVLATFRIGYPAAILNTTIATLSSQTSFTLTSGPAEDDALNGMWAVIHDVASAVQKSWVQILDYTGSTKTVTLAAGATFTAAATDNISVMFPTPLQPATTGSTLTVTSGRANADVTHIATAAVSTSTAQLGVNVVQVGASATPVTNLGVVFNTDFATNYNTTTDQWNVNVENWNTTAVPAEHTAGYPIVTIKDGTGTGEIDTTSGGVLVASIAANVVNASALATDAVQEIRNAITGGAYALDTDANGAIRIVDGTGSRELNTNAGAVALVDLVTTVTTLTNDPTGVTTLLSRLGTPSNLGGGATVAANLSDIEAQTDDIGTAGAGLSAIPWNAAWDAEVQSEANDALVANNLDHLVLSAVDTDFATTVHLNSVIGHLADNGTSASFDRTTDSLEALQAENDTTQSAIAALNNITAAAVWAVGTRTLTGFGFTIGASDFAAGAIDANALATDAVNEIRNAITGGAYDLDTDANGRIRIVDGTATAELDTSSGHVTLADGSLITAKLGTFALAKTTNITGFNDLSAAAVNAEVVDAIATDTYAEPGQGAPAATTTLVAKINYLYKSWRNKKTQTATERKLYADDGTTVDQKATDSDDSTTFTKGELVAGP